MLLLWACSDSETRYFRQIFEKLSVCTSDIPEPCKLLHNGNDVRKDHWLKAGRENGDNQQFQKSALSIKVLLQCS